MKAGNGSRTGHGHAASSPPSTTICAPLTYELRSEARKSVVRATSSGCASRRSGMRSSYERPLRLDVDSLRRAGLDELDCALGPRRPGRDRVDADAVGPELERHRLRQPPDRVLRGPVVREAGAARVDGVDRRDVDDRAAIALRPHPRRGGADAEEAAADVHAEDPLELLRRHVLEQEVREHAGVVDEHVEAAERRDGGRHQTLDVGLRRDVALGRRDLPPGGREAFVRGVEPVAPTVGDDDGGAGLGQPTRARKAESLRRARDDGHLPAQVDERDEAARLRRAGWTRHA